ncbi:hypothetical protein N7523_005768 [Penicillium sp. IBT 18751x]|nr:hypothetical protein N7523_005640 [Penicillium sp. IBT 18751x]KAJ6118017.1 hypothetical protein N7523_005768 [Penicillium sp. IBT 18751x]
MKVDVDSPERSTSDNQTYLDFPICHGSLETVEGFTPWLKSTSITGSDKAVLSSADDTLRLNVTTSVQIRDDPASETCKEITLRWRGSVSHVKRILSGDFDGQTILDKLIIFDFDADNKDLPTLGNRIFIGKGQVVKRENGLRLVYKVSEVADV